MGNRVTTLKRPSGGLRNPGPPRVQGRRSDLDPGSRLWIETYPIFDSLLKTFMEMEDGNDRIDLGLGLMPYLHPRLRSVEKKADTTRNITISIGGVK